MLGFDDEDDADDPTRLVTAAISWARAGVGMVLLLAPRLSLRVVGYPDAEISPAARYMARVAAVRELAVAGGSLAEVRSGGRPDPRTLLVNLACDGSDALVLVATAVGGRSPRRALMLGIPSALGVSAVWIWLLRRELAAA